MENLTGPWDLVVVGHGFSGLSTALSHLQHATSEGRTSRVAVLERAPHEGRGRSTMWTHAFLRLNPRRMLGPSWAENVRANAGPLANESCISAFYETTLLRLERNAQGISAVTVRSSSGIVSSMQTRTVVLASGGFEGNPEMLTRYLPDAYKLQTVSPGTRNNKGDGIRMAVEIGANTTGHFDGAHIEPCDPRSDGVEPLASNWFYGILVGQNGQRFMDEAETSYDVQFDTIANEIFRSGRKFAYAINDAQVKRLLPWMDPMTATEQPPIVADTIERLASALGTDPTVLRSPHRRPLRGLPDRSPNLLHVRRPLGRWRDARPRRGWAPHHRPVRRKPDRGHLLQQVPQRHLRSAVYDLRSRGWDRDYPRSGGSARARHGLIMQLRTPASLYRGGTSKALIVERESRPHRMTQLRRRPLRQAGPYQRALSPHGVRMAGLPICDSSMPSTATARKDSARV